MRAGLASRWLKALRTPFAWRQHRRTPGWSYWQNGVDGRRLAIQRKATEALDLSFIRPGDLVWGRDGMRFHTPEPVLMPWKEWRVS